jgi:hypothetical protein
MSYDSRGSESGEGESEGIQRASSCCVVHVRNEGFEGGVGAELLVGGVSVDWWALKFARRADVSSVLDFSNMGRRITEDVPVIMFLYVVRRGGHDGCAEGVTDEVDSMSFIFGGGGLAGALNGVRLDWFFLLGKMTSNVEVDFVSSAYIYDRPDLSLEGWAHWRRCGALAGCGLKADPPTRRCADLFCPFKQHRPTSHLHAMAIKYVYRLL